MVVLYPRLDQVTLVESERLGCLPGSVVDAEVDLRLCGVAACSARVPGPHVARRADGVLRIEDRYEALTVLWTDRREDVLDNTRHVQGDDDSAAQVVKIEERWMDADPVARDESLDKWNDLSQQCFRRALPRRPHLVEYVASRFEKNLLVAILTAEGFEIARPLDSFHDRPRVDALMDVKGHRRNLEAGVLGLAGPFEARIQVRVECVRPLRRHRVIFAGNEPYRGIIWALLVGVLVLLDGATRLITARAGGARSMHTYDLVCPQCQFSCQVQSARAKA